MGFEDIFITRMQHCGATHAIFSEVFNSVALQIEFTDRHVDPLKKDFRISSLCKISLQRAWLLLAAGSNNWGRCKQWLLYLQWEEYNNEKAVSNCIMNDPTCCNFRI